MAFDRFLIAPFNTGLQTNLRPWLIMDDAFEQLQNMYVFRGRLRKRFGSNLIGGTQQLSRLRIDLGANANMAVNLPGNAVQIAIGAMFSLGADIFTVWQLGAGVATLTTNGAITASINSTTNPNTITFTGGGGADIFYYPANPVMGITQYESGSINNHPTYAFDTQFAYRYTQGSGWARSGTAIWHGTDINFFWSINWQGSSSSAATGTPVLMTTNFFVTNYNGAGAATDDPIWWTLDGTTWTSATTNINNAFYFAPSSGSPFPNGPYVVTARIIMPFKNRLLLLNTVESTGGAWGAGTNTNYVNRCRYSFNGSPFAPNAWYEPNTSDSSGNIAAGAGFLDAATEEQIISAEFIKDRLIVYFERSTWEIVYTGNEWRPFLWQKLNTELGSQSQFSTVPFDQEILTVGNTGIHSCNGSNVARIDTKIPDEVFDFQTKNNAPTRTAGIRDYIAEVVYWAVCIDNEPTTQKYPNQILLYNYRNQSWALFDDTFTAFGYFEQGVDTTWASSAPLTWGNINSTWISGFQAANRRQILGGNQEGFILIIDPDISNRNAPSLQITNIVVAATGIVTLTIINHNLSISGEGLGFPDYILIENIVGDATIAAYLNGTIYQVNSIVDANTITINTNRNDPLTANPLNNNIGTPQVPLTTGTYTGGGTVARVSNPQIVTKQYNPYDKDGRNVYLGRIDFFVLKTDKGQITVDYFPSSSDVEMIQGGIQTGAIMGNSILETSPYATTYYPLEQFQERLVHPIYFQSTGECIQLALYLSSLQITIPTIALEDFELEGMILHTEPSSARLQ